jgi:hypothetical protein
MDPLMAQLLMGNIKQYAGAGMPGGQGYTGQIDKLLQLIGEQWPQLMRGYQAPAFNRKMMINRQPPSQRIQQYSGFLGV